MTSYSMKVGIQNEQPTHLWKARPDHSHAVCRLQNAVGESAFRVPYFTKTNINPYQGNSNFAKRMMPETLQKGARWACVSWVSSNCPLQLSFRLKPTGHPPVFWPFFETHLTATPEHRCPRIDGPGR